MIRKSKTKIEIIKEKISNSFLGLVFDEPSHSYTLDGNNLTSTTTFLKRYSTPFSGYNIAKAMAKKHNRERTTSKPKDEYYYLYRWKMQSTSATNYGTVVHNYAEFNYPDFIDPPSCRKEQGVVDFFSDLEDNYVVLFLELKMYIKEYNKAGTADLILYNKETDKIIIGDWKMNDKSLHQYYNNNTLLEPFHKLTDCSLNKYSLQLSEYKNMIQLNTEYEVEDLWLIHLNTNPYDSFDYNKGRPKYELDLSNPPVIIKDNYKLYKLKDYSKELLNEYKKINDGE